MMPLSGVADKPGDLLRGNDGRINREDRTLAETARMRHPKLQNRSTHGSPAPAVP
jgi:hypothetical protein